MAVCLGALLIGLLLLFSGLSNQGVFWLYIGLSYIGSVVAAAVTSEGAQAKLQFDAAQKRWRELEGLWGNKAALSRFQSKLNDLTAKKKEYLALSALRNEKLRKLVDQRKERQLYRYLDGFRIVKAEISGIGPSRRAILLSYGVETAADLTRRAILSVPGFGAVYASKLLAWRKSLESRFVFNPTEGVNPADVQVVEQEVTSARLRLEHDLTNGPNDLRRICQEIDTARSSLQVSVHEGLKALAQSEVDWKAASIPIKPVVAIGIAVLLSIAVGVPFREVGTNTFRTLFLSTSTNAQPAKAQNANLTPTAKTTTETVPIVDAQAESRISFANGVELSKRGRFEEAAQEFQRSITLTPDSAEANHELGYALYRLGKYRESAESSQRAIALYPKNAETLRNLGLALKAMQKWKDAAKAFREALKITPEHPPTLYNLGVCLHKLEEYEDAVQVLQQAVHLKPDYALAHYELGLVYLASDQTDAAFEEYTRLLDLNEKLAKKLYEAMPSTPQRPSPSIPPVTEYYRRMAFFDSISTADS